MPSWRIWAIAAVSLALAAFAANDALARVGTRQFPQLAGRLPFANGFAQTRLADLILARGLVPGSTSTLRLGAAEQRKAISLTRSGYRKEPLNNDALRDLALLAEADGRSDRARSMMVAAERLTKRDLATNAWLAADFARQGRMDQALALYDQALRSNSQARELLLPAMIDNLKNDDLVDPVVALLARRPPWQGAFWGLAPRYRAALPNLAKVRLALAERDVPVDRQYDRVLVAELGGAGHFSAAAALAGLLGPGRAFPGEQVANAEFERVPELLPFDWETILSASLTADIDPGSGVLRVKTFGDGSGPTVRQLIALPQIAYRLSVKASEWDAQDRNHLYVRLKCAEEDGAGNSRPLYLDRPDYSQAFTKPQLDCRYYWLTVYAAVQPGGQDNAVTVDRISIAPLAAPARSSP